MVRVPGIESARRKFLVLAALALLAGALLALGASPAHAETTFTVNSTADGGDNDTTDNKCFTGNFVRDNRGLFREECTLRAAIEQSNATAGTDTISFNIPTDDSGYDSTTGVWTITPASALPEITGPVTMNGYTQSGASANTNGPSEGDNAVLKIELNGINSRNSADVGISVLRISAGHSTVKGFVINRAATSVSTTSASISLTDLASNTIEGNFLGTDPSGAYTVGVKDIFDPNFAGAFCDGLVINTTGSEAGNTVGGTIPAARNVISSCGGVLIESSGNLVQGNLIGTNAAGTNRLGNRIGVEINGGSGNTVGGTAPAARNVISGNSDGVVVRTDSHSGVTEIGDPHDNSIQGNFIGTDVTGASNLGNGTGAIITGTDNTLGGTAAGAENTISASNHNGVIVAGTGNSVVSNTISSNSNSGVSVGGSSSSVVSNTISSNTYDGVVVSNGVGNSILSNTVSSNGSLGIDLQGPNESGTTDLPTDNDTLDTDSGPNNLQNFPILTSAIRADGTTTITGTLNSEADKSYNLEFFASPSADPSGYGEGQTYLGQTSAATNPSGNVSFTFTTSNVPAEKQVVTATATSPGGDTSEFSAAIPITPANDNFADAQAISGSTTPIEGTTANATRETGEPDHSLGTASLGEHSVWYRWTAPATGQVAIDTCTTSTDTILAVYTGDSLNNLSRVADNNDGCASGKGSKVSFNAQTGTTYGIAVAETNTSSEGTFTLDFSPMVTGVTTTKKRSGNVTVQFSEPMDPSSLMQDATDPVSQPSTSQSIVLLKGSSTSTTLVPAKVSCTDSTCKTVILNPDVRLGSRKQYTVKVEGITDVEAVGDSLAVEDSRDNKLAEDQVKSFKTGTR